MTAAEEPRYPSSKVSLFPILSMGSLVGKGGQCPRSILDSGNILNVTTGRMGLALALEHMGLNKDEKILIPSYHCNSMVEPVVHAGGIPVFYRIREDTSVDLEDIASRIDKKTKAIIVTHYFGFPQNLAVIRSFCDAHHLVLIEDCAHVFFGEHAGQLLGSFGDYAFASPMKFFPLYDGGYFISSRRPLFAVQLESSDVMFNLRALYTILCRSIKYGRINAIKPIIKSIEISRNLIKYTPRKATMENEHQQLEVNQEKYGFSGYFSGKAGEFDPTWIHRRMSWASQMVIKLTSKSRIATKRRENYLKLNKAFSDLPNCSPLYPKLPETVVPYVYPLVVEEPAEPFAILKSKGVPISRFGEYLWIGFEPSEFPEASKLSRQVLQFPCHQEINEKELFWIISCVRQAILSRS